MATTFHFDPHTSALIDDLQKHFRATSKTEVLRRAIALLETAKDADKTGARVVVYDPACKEVKEYCRFY